jgi:hypothetical protein
MKKESIKNLTEDALLCSLFTVMTLIVPMAMGSVKYFFGLAITAFFVCFNKEKGLFRVLCVGTVMLLLLSLFTFPYPFLSEYVWRIFAGVIVSRTIRFEKRMYYVTSFLTLMVIQIIKVVFTITVFTPMTTTEYIMIFVEQMQQMFDYPIDIRFVIPAVIIYTVGMVVIQCVIIDRLNMLYSKYFPKKIRSEY